MRDRLYRAEDGGPGGPDGEDPLSNEEDWMQSKPKPVLLLVAGLTGSGKTDMRKHVFRMYGVDDAKVVKILVDDLIVSDIFYKHDINKILFKFNIVNSESSIKVDNDEPLRNPSPELINEFAKAYYTNKKERGCFSQEGCDKLNDLKLEKALREKKHVCLEIVGDKFPEWLFTGTYQEKLKNYRTVWSYAIAPLCTLVERNKTRALRDTEIYLKNRKTNPAPRLPDVLDDIHHERNFLTRHSKVKETLIDVLQKCYDNKCPVEDVYVFDTSTFPSQLLLDRKTDLNEGLTRMGDILKLPDKTCN